MSQEQRSDARGTSTHSLAAELVPSTGAAWSSPGSSPGSPPPSFVQPAATRRSAGITQICEALDAAFDAPHGANDASLTAAFARAVRAALAQAAANAETLLTPAQREGSAHAYCRHLLAADATGRYALVALVWQPGQASPVHGHHTWCGYTVLSGTLTETQFDWNESLGCATYARTNRRAPGALSFTRAGVGGIHRLGNTGPTQAVSLHVYGVAGERVATHVNDIVRVAMPTTADARESNTDLAAHPGSA
jgi:predicted metal-dependent enzyme (double-stranded beta helix superfamily)